MTPSAAAASISHPIKPSSANNFSVAVPEATVVISSP